MVISHHQVYLRRSTGRLSCHSAIAVTALVVRVQYPSWKCQACLLLNLSHVKSDLLRIFVWPVFQVRPWCAGVRADSRKLDKQRVLPKKELRLLTTVPFRPTRVVIVIRGSAHQTFGLVSLSSRGLPLGLTWSSIFRARPLVQTNFCI